MKKWIYSFGIALFLFVAAYFVALRYLKASGISFSSLKVRFPFSIAVKDLTINTSIFEMTLGKAELDLSFTQLVQSQFSGHELLAEDVQIIVHPSDSPFSYSVIPVIKFDKVSLKNVMIRVPDNQDTIDLSFPEFTLDQLNWNDSLQVSQLNYKNGKFSFRYRSNSEDYNTHAGSPSVAIPEAVPKFRINQLKIYSLDLELVNQSTLTEIKDIHLAMHGWNNSSSASIGMDSLSFLVQDSLKVEITSNAMRVENRKGAGVKNLKIKLPGLDVDVKDFLATQTNSGITYKAELGRSSVSPALLKWWNRDLDLFKANAPKVFFEAKMNFANDTLQVNDVLVSLLDYSRVKASGVVINPTQLSSYFFKLSPLTVSGSEIAKVFSIDLFPELASFTLDSEIEIQGSASHFRADARLALAAAEAQLHANFNKTAINHWVGDLRLNSRIFNVRDLVPGADYDLTAYGLNLSSRLDLATLGANLGFHLTLSVDSLLNERSHLAGFSADCELHHRGLLVHVGDQPGSWKADLEIKTITNDQTALLYTGRVKVFDLSKLSSSFKGGPCLSEFNGKVKWSKDSMSGNIFMDRLVLTHESGVELNLGQSNGNWLLKNKRCSIRINHADTVVVATQFNLELLDWIKRPDKTWTSMPEVYFYTQLTVDSLLLDMFTGNNIHLQIKPLEFIANKDSLRVILGIPCISANGTFVKGINGRLDYNQKKRYATFDILKLTNSFVDIDSLFGTMLWDEAGTMACALKGSIPGLNEDFSVTGNLKFLNDNIGLSFNSNESFRLGGQTWFSEPGQGLLIHTKSLKVMGKQVFYNGGQRIEMNGDGEYVGLRIDSLRLGPLLELITTDIKAKANLSFEGRYEPEIQLLQANGRLEGIKVDTFELGEASFNILKNKKETRIKANAKGVVWNVNYGASNLKAGYNHDFTIDYFDLGRLDSALGFIPKEYRFAGQLTGHLNLQTGLQRSVNGQLRFQNVSCKMDEMGTSVSIDQQNIGVKDNQVIFEDFTIHDGDRNNMLLNGIIRLEQQLELDLGIRTKQFKLLNSDNALSLTRGKLAVESDLRLQGRGNSYRVLGTINVLKGGTVYHQYKGAVALSEPQDVIFTSFTESEKGGLIKRKSNREWLLNWNVDVNIGTTDIYILFSKSTQEYMRLSASGALQLRTSDEILPDVFGTVLSKNGKVYYEVPMVSDIEMDIALAKLNFRGDARNPLISFKGVETFRVTPNEMSAALNEKKNRVPVYVTAIIDEKPLKAVQLNFDIKSDQAEVQNMLLALPKETRESYAINMLVFGRINKGTESGNPAMLGVVKKMNEISRRNIKNADLSFHVDNIGGESADGAQNGNRIGYSFSKGFSNERIKITVGGDFEIGQHSVASHSTPLGSIQLEYSLREDPDISLVLKRENSYKGPIEGQVDESGVVFKYKKQYKNAFRNVKSDSLTIRKK